MKCKICGKEMTNHPYGKDNLICDHDCFMIDFWNNALDDSAIIIDGDCYHVGEENNSDPYFRGFGGRHFFIKMNDGRIIHTSNLWHQGTVPVSRHVSDNAKFIYPSPEMMTYVKESCNNTVRVFDDSSKFGDITAGSLYFLNGFEVEDSEFRVGPLILKKICTNNPHIKNEPLWVLGEVLSNAFLDDKE